MTYWFERFSDNVWVRAGLACIVVGTITTIFYCSLDNIYIADKDPFVHEITPEKKEKFGPFVASVDTGIFVRNFPDFNVHANRYVIDLVIWFMFDPRELTLESVQKFSFIKGFVKKQSEPDVKYVGNKILAIYDILLETTPELRFDRYPYDGHRLPIIVTNKLVSPGEVQFVTHPSRLIVGEQYKTNWEMVPDNFATKSGYLKAYLDARDTQRSISHPVAQYSIEFVPSGVKNMLIIFLPLLFAMLLSLFSFLVPYRYKGDNGLVWSLSITAITSVLGYRFVLQKIMPQVGYITTTDAVYTLALVVAFTPFLFQLLLSLLMRKEINSQAQGHEMAETINVISLVAFITMSAIIIFFLYRFLL